MEQCSYVCDHVETKADRGPESYKRRHGEYDEHCARCMNYRGPHSVFDAWRRYHPLAAVSSATTKHKIFDAGCGTGLVMEAFLQSGECPRQYLDIYGGDYSEDMIDLAEKKKLYDHLKVVNLKGKLPYEADTFDSIVCAGVFIPNHCGPECLPNILGVLKKGCYFVATIRTLLYKDNKEEWDKQLAACGGVLVEANDAPYSNEAKGLVLVIQKRKTL